MRRYLDQKLKLRQLRVISAIEAQGSLLKAAQALGLTQPALSKALAEIEDLAGVRLFERHARGVVPSPHGLILADAARRTLAIVRDAEDAIERLDDQLDGTVVVGALPTAAAGLMPSVIQQLRRERPGITVRVIEDRYEEQLGALALGDLDLVVGRFYAPTRPEENIIRTELYDEPMAVIIGNGHPLAHRLGAVDPADLAAYEVSLPVATLRIHADTQAFLSHYDIQAHEGLATTSLTLLRELLVAGELVTIMPRLMLAGDILRGTLRAVRLAGPRPPARPAGLFHRADRPLMPPAQHLSRLIAAHAAEILAGTEP